MPMTSIQSGSKLCFFTDLVAVIACLTFCIHNNIHNAYLSTVSRVQKYKDIFDLKFTIMLMIFFKTFLCNFVTSDIEN